MSSDEQLIRQLSATFARVELLATTGSTNADARALALQGAPDRSVVIAEEQTAGLGRRNRSWVSPRGAGLYCSVLLRPAGVAAHKFGLITLLAGIALARTAQSLGVAAVVKWPNDLLVPELGKLAGVLAESVDTAQGPAIVLGMGLNIAPLPRIEPGAGNLAATSLIDAGASNADRDTVARTLLTELSALELPWRDAGGDIESSGALQAYRDCCATLGQAVRVDLGAEMVHGTARDIDEHGQLIVDVDGVGQRVISAGDVVHLRPGG